MASMLFEIWVELSAALAEVWKIFGEIATHFLIVCGALLAMVSLRNGHIAERSRNNVSEAISIFVLSSGADGENIKESDKGEIRQVRLRSLAEQNDFFSRRYRNTSVAFVLLAVSMIFGIFAFGTTKVTGYPLTEGIKLLGGAIAVLAMAFVLIALGLMALEFRRGPQTLEMNNSIFTAIAKLRGAEK